MKKIKKALILSLFMVICCMNLTGCVRKYDKPELVTIEASQTAFLIPLVGDSNEQAAFGSEEALAQAKIATKEVQIPHRWVQMGRRSWIGEWRPSAKLIVVERKPVTREWSADADNGTSNANQAIFAESAESIGFSVAMNCTAQIYDEDDAVKFLYSYNNIPLETVMDNEIRPKVETVWNELCTSRAMEDIRVTKANLMEELRNTVIPYFQSKGITITTLGLKEGFTYEDPKIQTAINEQIISEKQLVTAQNDTKVKKEQADAEAYVTIKAAEAQAEANKKLSESLTPELMKLQQIQALANKWNGEVPQVMGADGSILGLDLTNGETTK